MRCADPACKTDLLHLRLSLPASQKIKYLKHCRGLLECLQELQRDRGWTSQSISDEMKARLQEELDVKYSVCIFETLQYDEVGACPLLPRPCMLKAGVQDYTDEECREEYTILEGPAMMRGRVPFNSRGIVQMLINKRYARCTDDVGVLHAFAGDSPR